MPNCINCSAPLPVDGIRCDYCGSRNDVDLQGVHYFTTHETDSVRTCPRCNRSLQTIDLQLNGTFLIERCEECLGLFFDPGELEAVLTALVSNVFTINHKRLDRLCTTGGTGERTVSYIKCPVCTTVMNRINFGVRSGVVVDRCREHGIWLDGGELRRLCEWMKAGGKLLDQERREQREKERLAEKARQLGNRPSMEATGDPFTRYSGPLREEDPDLFEIVRKAMRLFSQRV